jgi:hypothetical protein
VQPEIVSRSLGMIGLSSNGVVYFKFASVEGRLWKKRVFTLD